VQIKNVLEELESNTSARIPITPNGIYTLNLNNNRYFNYTTSGLNTKTTASSDSQWKLVLAATEGTYYIQHHESGNYISEANSGKRAKAASNDVVQAIAFKLIDADAPGEFFIQTNDTELNLYNNANASNRIYAGIQNGTTAKWILTLIGVDDTRVSTLEEYAAPKIWARDGEIIINELNAGEIICVYDATGKLLTTATSTSSSITIQTGLAKGQIAIITLGAHSEKILMK
jgi:outer membrane protein assembly factor BamB